MRLSAVLSLLLTLSSVANEYTVEHLTGSLKGAGFADGNAQTARLMRPSGIDADSSGNVYIADSDAHTIRRIAPDGSVTTFAGLSGVSGTADGKGGSARFYFPRGIAVDISNNVYVGESRIRKITPSGVVSTFASVPANAVAVDASGNVYAAGSVGGGQYGITRITQAGETTLLSGTSRSTYITDVAVDSATGKVFFTSSVAKIGGGYSYNLYQRDSSGVISTIANGEVSYVAVEAGGTLVTTGQTEYGGAIVERITGSGLRTLLAGTGSQGGQDGAGGSATFLFTSGIATAPGGVIYVTEAAAAYRVRKISSTNFVSTLAGGAPESQRIDGSLQSARFSSLIGIARDASGNVYVADGIAIRKITPAGVVSTLAGGSGWGYDDGVGTAAKFHQVGGIAVDASGSLFVTDIEANTIRKVTPEGMVTTFAGLGGSAGAVNATGTAARFRRPYGITVDPSGNVYVADSGNHAIRKITPAREVTTFAGTLGSAGNVDATGVAASFTSPSGIVRASDGTLYVSANNAIRRITTPGAEVSTFAGTSGGYGNVDGTGTGAGFLQLGTLGIDANDNLFAADNFMLRKVTTPGAVVTTVAGKAYAENLANVSGTGPLARFAPSGVTGAGGNDLYLSDGSSQNIRIVTVPGIDDAATASTTIAPVGSVVVLGTTPETATNWTWTLLRRPTGSTAELSSTSVENPTFVPDVADVFVFLLRAEGVAGVRYSTVTITGVDCVVTGSISAALVGASQVCLTGTGGTAQATLTGGASGPLQWGWRSVSGGLITNIAGATSSSYIVNGAHFGGTGLKYLVATVVSNCGSPLVSNEIPVQISSPPDSAISASSGVYASSTTNFASVGDAGPGATYTWSVTDGAIEAGQGTSRIRYSAGASGEVTISVAIQNGCSANAQTTVPIIPRPAGASLMYLVTPCRVIDTRDSWPVGDGTTRTLVVGGLCGVPVEATAVALNVTAIAPAAPGYASLYPPTIVWPGTSTLNYRTGRTRANNAVVALGPDGTLLLKNVGATTHFVVDVTGYFQ